MSLQTSSRVTLFTFTTDGQFPLTLVGNGDGGPNTTLIDAWITLPLPSGVVQLLSNGQPTTAITQASLIDRLPVHLADAHELVRNPKLRELLRS